MATADPGNHWAMALVLEEAEQRKDLHMISLAAASLSGHGGRH